MKRRGQRWIAWALWLAMACQPNRAPAPDAGVELDAAAEPDAGARALPAFCAREGDDAVRDLFCSEHAPHIGSLAELQSLLEIDDPNQPGVRFSVLGHSTALSGHLVSPINPRVIFIGVETLAAFSRGVQRVELIGDDRNGDALNFYLLSFEQACNRSAAGCVPGDLYTPRIEEAWTRVRIEDDEDLKNTAADCRQCHQRGQPEAKLLMRELNSPWTHFFFPPGFDDSNPGVGGSDLTNDYLIAKGDERYAGVSIGELDPSEVLKLQLLTGEPQPLLFDAPAIMSERYPYGPEGLAEEAVPSPTWEASYEAFKRGEQLALPYFESRVTDPDKQAALSAAYQRFVAGELGAEQLPDLADIFPDDPSIRARIGLQTDPSATPQQALIQACGSCHNDVLDQSISRARFNVDLSRLDRIELELAVERLEREPTEEGAMPPPEARALDPQARAMLLEYLRDPASSAQPDPELQRAAELGMAGGAGP